MYDTLIIVPAYNEQENIAASLESLLAEHIHADVLVVNDGSLDATVDIARRYPVYVLSHPCNMGYGSALQTGYKFALRHGYAFAVQYDADGQHSAADVQKMIMVMHQSAADLTIGSRFAGDAAFHPGVMKLLAIRWFRFLIRLFTGRRISDPTSGLRGLSRALMAYYANSNQFPSDFPDADFVLDVLLRRWQVGEVPIGHCIRSGGRSMHSGWKPMVYVGKVTVSAAGIVLNHVIGRRGMAT